jgi:heat shock protein HspQ
MSEAKFAIGQIVQHKLFYYRGLIIDVDYKFLGSDEWYVQVARSCPPKNQPWYHMLVDNAIHQTYVAERNLELSNEIKPIHHPLLEHYFNGLVEGQYSLRARQN